MTWQHLEKIFNRAVSYSFSKTKCLLIFLTLALCGLFSVICRAASIGASSWIVMSLTFLPIFLCSGILLASGLVLIRLYHEEIKGKKGSVFRTFRSMKGLFFGIPYLTVPLIFAYLILWMILGVFYLLREIPHIGGALGSILSFGPFLLVLGSIVLGFISLLTLFFVTPAAALQNDLNPKLAERVLGQIRLNPFFSSIMLLIGILPLLVVALVLCLATLMTHLLYVEGGSPFAIVMRWFFMMLPFCALMTPAVIFLFNFACEAHVEIVRKSQAKDETIPESGMTS